MVKKRNGEIDLLRILFSVIIVIFHFNLNYNFDFFSKGNICVEFFFVVSGFLVGRQIEKYASKDPLSGKEIADITWKLTSKKISATYFYYFSVVVLQIIIRDLIIKDASIANILLGFLRSIPTFTLSFMGLLHNGNVSFYVGNTWFLSAMFIVLLIIYPLLLKSYDMYTKIVFPLLTIFILGYLYAEYGSVTVWEDWTGFTYQGILRAAGDMCLGISLCPLSKLLSEKLGWLINSKKVPIKLSLTLIKVFCYCVIILYAYGRRFEQNFTLHALLFCAFGVLLSFTNVGYCVPDSALTRFFGKISMPIFIYHGFIRWSCHDLIPDDMVTLPMFIGMIVGSIVVSVLLMYITDFILKGLKLLFSGIKKHC